MCNYFDGLKIESILFTFYYLLYSLFIHSKTLSSFFFPYEFREFSLDTVHFPMKKFSLEDKKFLV